MTRLKFPRPGTHWAIAAAVLIGVPAVADQPFFSGLGDLDGGPFWSEVLDISADASTVVGSSESTEGLQAYRWTNPASGGAGMQGLGDLPSGPFSSIGWGVSSDGGVIVGIGQVDVSSFEAFRWTDPAAGGSGMVSLGDLPGGPVFGGAVGASADGSVAVGWGTTESGLAQAFRWTDPSQGGNGMVALGLMTAGTFSRATAVNPDGSIVIGRGNSANGNEGFRWTDPAQGGAGMVGLGDLTGGSFRSNSNDLSDDGSVIVGAGFSNTGVEAYRWSDPAVGGAGMVALGLVPGFGASEAYAVSADGNVIVGAVLNFPQSRAMYWTDPTAGGTGMVRLHDLLVNEFGLNLTGWTLNVAKGISADGRTIVGNGVNPSGAEEGWIAHLGSACAGDLDGDGDTDLGDLGILLADFGCGTPGGPPPPCPGDLDGDGDTDLGDLGILLADFGCGTP